MDVTPFIQAKSDQLNADDLISGPITVQITGVTPGNKEQPVNIQISGGHMQFRPSKTALRVLTHAWGPEATRWVGRWLRLYRDETVRFGGETVGGIRISALSHIDEPMTISLAETRAKKKTHRIAVLKPNEARSEGKPTADLDKLLTEAGLTREDVDRWLVKNGKPVLDGQSPEAIARLAGWLGARPATIDAIRALVPAVSAVPAVPAAGSPPDDDFPPARTTTASPPDPRLARRAGPARLPTSARHIED
jgi:hypothetical protein